MEQYSHAMRACGGWIRRKIAFNLTLSVASCCIWLTSLVRACGQTATQPSETSHGIGCLAIGSSQVVRKTVEKVCACSMEALRVVLVLTVMTWLCKNLAHAAPAWSSHTTGIYYAVCCHLRYENTVSMQLKRSLTA